MERVRCPVLIGRADELALLQDLLRRADGRDGHAALIAGDAGIGKSRLVAELVARAAAAGAQVLSGACAEAELTISFLPFVEAISNRLALDDGVRDELGPFRHELARLVPSLSEEPPPVDPHDPAAGRLRLFDAAAALIRHLGRRSVVVLVVEDLQWADPSTRELFDYLVRVARPLRLLLIGTCRLEDLPRRHPLRVLIRGWVKTQLVERIDLNPLGPSETRAMLRETVGPDRFNLEAMAAIQARSEGNPLVLEELLKAAEDGGWEGGEAILPRTLREGVLERVERLLDEEAEVLRAAAVLGLRFSLDVLSAVCRPAAVGHALDVAVAAQLVDELDGDLGLYQFRHALTRDAVYEDLIAPRRRALHAAAAAALAAIPGVPAADLCRHLVAAHDWQAAAPLFIRAAEEAEAAYSHEDAAAIYTLALKHLEGERLQAELECRLGRSHLHLGEVIEARRHLEAGIRRLDRIGESRLAAGFRVALAVACWQGARLDLARAELEMARRVLEAEGPSEDLAMVHVRLAGVNLVELEGEAAIESATRAAEIATAAAATPARIWAYGQLGAALASTGSLTDGLEYLDQSYREARAAGLHLIAADALYQGLLWRLIDLRPGEAMMRVEVLRSLSAGNWTRREADIAEAMTFWWGFGQPLRAVELLEPVVAAYTEAAEHTWIAWAQINLAAASAQLGRFPAARRLLEGRGGRSEPHLWMFNAWNVMRIGLDSGDLEFALSAGPALLASLPLAAPLRRILLDVAVEALVTAQHLAEAHRIAHDALPAIGESPLVDRVRARLALASGDRTAAVAAFGEAASGFAARGIRHEEARTRIALAGALEQTGQRAAAIAELRSALGSARARGALHEERLAHAALGALGALPHPSVDQIKGALEALLHSPSLLSTSPLVELACLGPAPDGRAERLTLLLRDLVADLATSSDHAEKEAGRVLSAYYFERLGSHERVAERLHLSMPTYYRRLRDVGHRRIAELLAQREALAIESRLGGI